MTRGKKSRCCSGGGPVGRAGSGVGVRAIDGLEGEAWKKAEGDVGSRTCGKNWRT